MSGVVAEPAVEATPWSTPRRLHPLSPLIGLVREVRRLFVLAVLIVLGVQGSGGLLDAVAPGAVALLGILVWLRTTFSATADELRRPPGCRHLDTWIWKDPFGEVRRHGKAVPLLAGVPR